MNDTIVVGIGNPFRGDDGAGWAVIDALEAKNINVPLCKQRGDIAELLDVFAQYSNVYLVDACTGVNVRIDVQEQSIPEDNPQTSTHGMGIAQAVALAKNLNLLPKKLILYAIAGKNFNIGDPLSPSLDLEINRVANAIEGEIICMKKASWTI
jgi:hydrogenase maturation protease